jgi:hypothetical protein
LIADALLMPRAVASSANVIHLSLPSSAVLTGGPYGGLSRKFIG